MDDELDIGLVEIECPECEFEFDEDHVCNVCECTGGQGTINVLDWIRNNPDILKRRNPSDVGERILEATLGCPECGDMHSDDQYTCTTCWCEGGQGDINIIDYINNDTSLLTK